MKYDKKLEMVHNMIREETKNMNDVNIVLRHAHKSLTSHYLRFYQFIIPLERFGDQLHLHTRLHLFRYKFDSIKMKRYIRSFRALKIVHDLVIRGDATRDELQRSLKHNFSIDIKRSTLYDYLVKLELSGWVSSYRVMKGNVGNLHTYFYFTGSGQELSIGKQ